jgi:predicted metal-dependent hydrolase
MGREIALLKTDQGEIALNIRVSPRARRIGLRVDPRIGGAELVLPKGVSKNSGLKFARSKWDWLCDHLSALPKPIPFVDGAEFPFMGVPVTICHMGRERSLFGPVWRENDALCVTGEPEHLSRRIHDWLKQQARLEITRRAQTHAESLDVRITRITLRDPRSRWGSCSVDACLSLSWRLILSPENVLDYVVAHEVAHIRQMDHSAKFWRLVEHLSPDSETPKAWLRLHGSGLHRYGAT